MKAIHLHAVSRRLDVVDMPAPGSPPPGHVVVDVEACGINHGDKLFLAAPAAAGGALNGLNRVWGASAAGRVRAVGSDVAPALVGRHVAIYRSLTASAHTIGLWAEQAQVPLASCLPLPDDVDARDYCGSLVNVITAFAFLEQVAADGHAGIIATAGASATACALAVLARRRQMPVIHLVRSAPRREQLRARGFEHVLATEDADFAASLAERAGALDAGAVFDGLGGALTGRLMPHLPMNATVYLYGMLDAAAAIAVPARSLMSRNLTLRRFSNFNTETVRNPLRRAAALADLEGVIGEPLLRTAIGKTFAFDEIEAALAYTDPSGARAVLVPPDVGQGGA